MSSCLLGGNQHRSTGMSAQRFERFPNRRQILRRHSLGHAFGQMEPQPKQTSVQGPNATEGYTSESNVSWLKVALGHWWKAPPPGSSFPPTSKGIFLELGGLHGEGLKGATTFHDIDRFGVAVRHPPAWRLRDGLSTLIKLTFKCGVSLMSDLVFGVFIQKLCGV